MALLNVSREDQRALEIGRAIMEEADFRGYDLDQGDIEHQLGTVWIGDRYVITIMDIRE